MGAWETNTTSWVQKKTKKNTKAMRRLENYETYLWLHYVKELNIIIKKQRLLDWIESTDILKAYTTLENYGHPGLQILTNIRKDDSAHTHIRTAVTDTVGCPSVYVLPTFFGNRTPDF